MNNKLRGAIMTRYKTIGDFATDLKWSRNKASRIVNGVQEPNIEDIKKIAVVLGIKEQQDFIDIFFEELSTMW